MCRAVEIMNDIGLAGCRSTFRQQCGAMLSNLVSYWFVIFCYLKRILFKVQSTPLNSSRSERAVHQQVTIY